MKRTFITALSLSVLVGMIVGCSKNDLVKAPYSKEMSFSTHVNTATKGLIKSQFNIGDQFAIMATESAVPWTSSDGTWYMGGGTDQFVTVTNSQNGNATAWTYNPIKLWPDVNKVSFFAFSPIASVTNGISNVKAVSGSPTLDFTVATDIKSQIDLLRAEALDKYDQEVQLAFSHALTRVSFAAKANVTTSQRVRLDKISLKGIKNSGSLKLYNDGRQIGSLNDMGGWSSQAGAAEYVPALTHEVASLITTDLMPVTAEDQALFMIPQEFTVGGDALLEVVYSYSNDGGKKWVNNAKFDINLDEYTQYWNPSKSYRYVLTLSPDKVYSFSADIVDWDDEIDVTVKNPFSVASLTIDPTGGLPTELMVTETRGQALGYTLKSSEPTWITIATEADGTGAAGEVEYDAQGNVTTKAGYEMDKKWYVVTQPNTTGAIRYGYIEVLREGLDVIKLEIAQNGSNPLKDCTLPELEITEGVYKVTKLNVANSSTLTHKLKSNVDWFMLSLDGIGTGTSEIVVAGIEGDDEALQDFYVHVKPNVSKDKRESYVIFETINAQGASSDIARMPLLQKAQTNPFTGVVALDVVTLADKYELAGIKVAKGAEFTITSKVAWLTLSTDGTSTPTASVKMTSTGNDKIYLHYADNVAAAARNTDLELTFTDGTDTHSYTAKQKAQGNPFASSNALDVAFTSGKYELRTIKVTKDVEFTITSKAPWITLSLNGTGTPTASIKMTSTANDKIWVHYDLNRTTSARSSALELTYSNHPENYSYTVRQKATSDIYIGRIGGTLRTEAVGGETHYYYTNHVFAAPLESGTYAFSTINDVISVPDFWSGLANTNTMISKGSARYPAAAKCNQKTGASYFMMAKSQLIVCLINGNLGQTANWLSSTEDRTGNVISMNHEFTQRLGAKTEPYYLRCVREAN